MEYHTQFGRYAADHTLTDFTALTDTTTGDELLMSMQLLRDMRERKRVVVGGAVFRDVTVTVPKPASSPGSALVTYCFDRSRMDVRDATTGDRIADQISNYEEEATLELEHGVWRVASIKNRVASC